MGFVTFYTKKIVNGILLPKLFLPTVRKKCDLEKLLKFEAEGSEVATSDMPHLVGFRNDDLGHGLRTPNEGINQRCLKNWADVADKIFFSRT